MPHQDGVLASACDCCRADEPPSAHLLCCNGGVLAQMFGTDLLDKIVWGWGACLHILVTDSGAGAFQVAAQVGCCWLAPLS